MTFQEIARKITGISFPVFGISWNPPKAEIEIARKAIIFLEDRRVLYNSYQLENPDYCYQSVIKIREFLTEQLNEVKKDSELNSIFRGMRASCRKVLDSGAHNYNFNEKLENGGFGPLDAISFFSAIGIFRGEMGILIAKILIMYGIDFEENLLSIIPFEEK